MMNEQVDNLRSVINLFTTGLLQIAEEQKQRLDTYGMQIARLQLDNDQLQKEVKELREHIVEKEVAQISTAFTDLEKVEESYRKHFGPIPPITER